MKVKNGVIVKVANKNRHRLASAEYLAVWIEDKDGRNERCIMLTKAEYAAVRTALLPFDMVLGRLYPCIVGADQFFTVKVIDAVPIQLCVTTAMLARFEGRARANAEDIPKKGFLADMLD